MKWVNSRARKRKERQWEKEAIRNKTVFHRHYNQIIVSEQELLIQLKHAHENRNLAELLIWGKAHPRYERLLLLVSLKFSFLGSLFYPVFDRKRAEKCGSDYWGYDGGKPPIKQYEKEVFDCYMDSAEEAQEVIERLTKEGKTPPSASAKELFEKYTAVKKYCVRAIAGTGEAYFASTYKDILEYIIENGNGNIPPPDFSDSGNLPENVEYHWQTEYDNFIW